MKKRFIIRDLGPNYTQAYKVVAHARYQQLRGRRPSMPYHGCLNPRLALQQALVDLLSYDPPCGELIEDVLGHLVAIANVTGQPFEASFNNVNIIARRGDNVTRLRQQKSSQEEAQLKNLAASGELTRRLAEDQLRKSTLTTQLEQAMSLLPQLDFVNLNQLISWLELVEEPLGSNQIEKRDATWKIVLCFHNHGYETDENCGPSFRREDEVNFARYIIGQALSGLLFQRYISRGWTDVVNLWRQSFGKTKEVFAI